jgi:hypothetical protein
MLISGHNGIIPIARLARGPACVGWAKEMGATIHALLEKTVPLGWSATRNWRLWNGTAKAVS